MNSSLLRWLLLAPLSVAPVGVLAASSVQDSAADPVVARVDDRELSRDEFSAWLVGRFGAGKVRAYALKVAVEQEAAKAGLTVPEDDVQRALNEEIAARLEGAFAGDRERWLRELSSMGLDEERYRERRAEEIRLDLLSALLMNRGRNATEEEIQSLFERRFGPDGRQLSLRALRLKVTAPFEPGLTMTQRQQRTREMQAKSRAKLLALRARIEAGEAFEKVARETSEDEYAAQGGVIPGVFRGDRWPRAFVQAIRELEGAAISEPIYGRGFVGIYQIVKEERMTMDAVRADLEREILQRGPSAGERAAKEAELFQSQTFELLPGLTDGGRDPQEPVARWGDQTITRIELGLWIAKKQGAGYLGTFVQDDLVYRAAEAIEWEPSEAAVKERVDAEIDKRIEAGFRGDVELWKADLVRRGSSPEQVRALRLRQAHLDLRIDELVRRQRKPSEADLQRAFESEHGPGGRSLDVRLLRRNLVPPRDLAGASPDEQARAQAEARVVAEKELDGLAQRIRAGEDFGTLAAELSDDPGTRANRGRFPGRFPLEQWPAAVSEALQAAKPGELLGPLFLPPGAVFLFELRGIREVAFESVKEELRRSLIDAVPSVPERSSFLVRLQAQHAIELFPERLP